METVDSRGKGEEREVKGGGIREMNESRVQRPESAEPERWMDEKEVRKGLKIFKGHQRTEKKRKIHINSHAVGRRLMGEKQRGSVIERQRVRWLVSSYTNSCHLFP
jgi:hypothetical protein